MYEPDGSCFGVHSGLDLCQLDTDLIVGLEENLVTGATGDMYKIGEDVIAGSELHIGRGVVLLTGPLMMTVGDR